MASSQPTNVFIFIFNINCQYLKVVRTPGESTEKQTNQQQQKKPQKVEKYIFNRKSVGGGDTLQIKKETCGPFVLS